MDRSNDDGADHESEQAVDNDLELHVAHAIALIHGRVAVVASVLIEALLEQVEHVDAFQVRGCLLVEVAN